MNSELRARPDTFKIMLAGDVMLGRGIDQILPHSSPPELYEPYVGSALRYVALAERKAGPLPRGVSHEYVWGDALTEIDAQSPDLRIVNLETAITRSSTPAEKGIHYRMEPANVPVLNAAAIDCCILANNHVLDWGEEGLLETLETLHRIGITPAGAGRNSWEAEAPAFFRLDESRRVLIFASAMQTSGVPAIWAATPIRPGVSLLSEDADSALESIVTRVGLEKRDGDIVIFSLHWGPNWGYGIPVSERLFARRLIEEAGVDIVYGHSSHHPKAIEIHGERAILYGCGDLLNDYEGIEGEEAYRPDLSLIYLLTLGQDGACLGLQMLPFRIAGFRLNRASPDETHWLAGRMDRECRRFGRAVLLVADRGGSHRLKLGSAPAAATRRRLAR